MWDHTKCLQQQAIQCSTQAKAWGVNELICVCVLTYIEVQMRPLTLIVSNRDSVGFPTSQFGHSQNQRSSQIYINKEEEVSRR